MHDDNDSLALLNSIKGIAYKFESQKNIYLSLDNAKAAYYTYRQGREETDSEFAANFGNITKVIEHYGGQVHEDSATLLEELKTSTGDATITINTATTAQLIVAKEARKRKCHGMGMLRRADRDRYGQLVIDLENQHTFGTDKYPTSMTDTYALLTNYKKPRLQKSRGQNHIDNAPPPTGEEGMTFVQRAAEPPIEEVQCYNCQQLGHYAGRCTNPYVPRVRPEPEPVTGVQFLQETITPMEESTEDDDENSDTELDFTFAQTMERDRSKT
jgi:hypothetical protein